jgi:hypothetical protein
MFDEEKEEKEEVMKDAPKTGRFEFAHGRMPVSATYGSDFPTCWMKHANKQITHTS